MMLKNRKWVGWFIFLAWMFCSTSIIISIVNRNINIRKIETLPTDSQKSIYYWIDDLSVSNDLWNTVSVYGWMIGLPEKSESGKEVSLIFKSDNDIYSVEAKTFQEGTVFEWLKDQNLDVLNENIRYGVSFSPLKFKNGVYQLFLSCQEKEGENGIVATNRFIKKDAKGVCIYDKISEEVVLPELSEENHAKGYGWINTIKLDKEYNCLKVEGWGFLDGMDSTYQRVIVGLKTRSGEEQYFEAFPCSWFDLVGYEGNMQCQNAGISAIMNIGNELVLKEDITIYIMNGDKWFSFKPETEIQY